MHEGIYMSKKGQFQFETVTEFLHGKLSRKEAALLLGSTERTVSRIARRIEKRGIAGVVSGNRGREPANKACSAVKCAIMSLVREKYYDFNMKHALEILKSEHKIEVGYDSYRRWCHEAKLVKRCKRRKTKARHRRVRMANEGLLLQIDGSHHHFNGKDEWCLIAAIDDATSKIPYAEFFHEEDTLSTMIVLKNIIERVGLPHAIYVDGAGCFGGGKRAHFNQFKRACEELQIRLIVASSPEAKGRIERAWDTFQDRIMPEMRLRNIRSMPAANNYLQEQFLPNYWNQRNVVVAKDPITKYRPLSSSTDLREILCLKDSRMVRRDHTLNWQGVTYQLDSPVKYSIYKQQIEFRTYLDLTWGAFYAGRPIELKVVEEILKRAV